jgi:hypothetical protein
MHAAPSIGFTLCGTHLLARVMRYVMRVRRTALDRPGAQVT